MTELSPWDNVEGQSPEGDFPTSPGQSNPPHYTFAPLRTGAIGRLLGPKGLVEKSVLTVAPVGYGKTVLMSQVYAELQRRGKACFWLTLDDRDTSVERLIAGLSAVLGDQQQQFHPMHALFRGQDSSSERVERLIQALNSLSVPVTLFIDNLQFCADPQLGRLLDALIFRTGSGLQLMLSSTHNIPVDIVRGQLQGLVLRIGPVDLTFKKAEVAALLGSELQQTIGDQGLARVMEKTEGWPAAVRLTQVVLSEAADPWEVLRSFSGSDETLANFLNRQVFSGFSAELRHLLIQVASLRTFCIELCEASIDEDQVKESINELLKRNVLVIPLDRNRRWYRLHSLFRDFLLHEAESDLSVEKRHQIYRNAAAWFRQNNNLREAIGYALLAEDRELVVPLLHSVASSLVRDRGAGDEFIGWMEHLHQLGLRGDDETEYWFIWALAFLRRYDQARHQVLQFPQAERLSNSLRESDEAESSFYRKMAILRASIDSLTDHLHDSYINACQWLAEADTNKDDAFNLTVAHCIIANYHTAMLEFGEARQQIMPAREGAFQAQSIYVDSWVSCYSALLGAAEGDYAGQYNILLKQLTKAKADLGNQSGICGMMALICARFAVGMALDEEAEQLLDFGISSSLSHGFLETVACGFEAAILLWGKNQAPPVSMERMQDIANAYPPRLSYMLSCYYVRHLIGEGLIEEARTQINRLEIGKSRDNKHRAFVSTPIVQTLESLIFIELHIASGALKQAQTLIDQTYVSLKNSRYYSVLVELVLNALTVAVVSGNLQMAVKHFYKAIQFAAAGRILKPFLMRAATIQTLIANTKRSAWRFPSEVERHFFEEISLRLVPSDTDESHTGSRTSLLDNLTAREKELLGYLDAGLSNQQIADRIEVSVTTVKWHLQNLYGKLGVSSRNAAVAEARNLQLLGR